jgi:hypothetical protein
MMVLTITGILLHFRLPHGSHDSTLMGFTRHQWGEFHFWVAIVFVCGIIVHSLLHLSWIKAALSPKNEKERKYNVLVFSFGIYFLLIFAFLIALSPIVKG